MRIDPNVTSNNAFHGHSSQISIYSRFKLNSEITKKMLLHKKLYMISLYHKLESSVV